MTIFEIREAVKNQLTEDVVGDVGGLVGGLDKDSDRDKGEIARNNRLQKSEAARTCDGDNDSDFSAPLVRTVTGQKRTDKKADERHAGRDRVSKTAARQIEFGRNSFRELRSVENNRFGSAVQSRVASLVKRAQTFGQFERRRRAIGDRNLVGHTFFLDCHLRDVEQFRKSEVVAGIIVKAGRTSHI